MIGPRGRVPFVAVQARNGIKIMGEGRILDVTEIRVFVSLGMGKGSAFLSRDYDAQTLIYYD